MTFLNQWIIPFISQLLVSNDIEFTFLLYSFSELLFYIPNILKNFSIKYQAVELDWDPGFVEAILTSEFCFQ